ncbi:hypothetical protein DITRI_Ditri10aG0176500 [Diplodiscus trichospermus]
MKRSRKSNKVSWAPDGNLCQVKLFLREDCPAKVSGEHQDTLQVKTSWTLHSTGMCANDLPPGFESNRFGSGLNHALAEIPRTRWTCPPKVVLNLSWHLAEGEESKEVEAQKLREMRVLEAVYPCHSVIPPSPCVSRDVEIECYDDSLIPVVPLTPIEDEEGVEISSDFAAQAKTPSNSETAAFLMPPVMKSKELGSLIDTDLLLKILSDPKMVDKLIHNHQYLSVAANVVSAPAPTSEPETGITSSVPLPKPAKVSPSVPADRCSNHLQKEYQPTLAMPAPGADMVSVSMPKGVESSVPLSGTNINMISGHKAAKGNGYSMQPAHSQPAQPSSVQKAHPAITSTPMQPNAGLAVAAKVTNPVKDANYIKNLIREHGREKQEAKVNNMAQNGSHFNHIPKMKVVQNLKPVALKTKFRKPCMYFNSPKGCRHGFDCPYLHDKSYQWQTGRNLEAPPSAKRMKLGQEIAGRI